MAFSLRCWPYAFLSILFVVKSTAHTNTFDSPILNAQIDITAKAVTFPHYWKECVGSGHMLLGTRSDWQAHLKLANTELGFKAIRAHGIFDDDMSAAPSKGKFDFYNTDVVFDYLVSLGMRPIVELSFMPSSFVACGNKGQPKCNYAFRDHGGYKGLTMPPDDFNDWFNLVKALGQHLVDRYGLKEVQQWHFEVWNEMWGISFPNPYMKLFNASFVALKSVDKKLRVGGPATMQVLDVGDFIKACRNEKIDVDFVSTHFYPTDPQCRTDQTKMRPDCFSEEILSAQKLAKAANLPFFITEYNNGLGGASRDDSSAAAFVFRQLGLLQDLDIFSWWTFSDVFEEQWMNAAPFHNGFGAMTMQGTRKPVWRAFELLNSAGNKRLPVSGFVSPGDPNSTISILATISDDGVTVSLYVANYHRLGDVPQYSCNNKTKICFEDKSGPYTDETLCNANCNTYLDSLDKPIPTLKAFPARNVTIKLIHAKSQTLGDSAVGKLIDDNHANPQKLWKSWGSPQYITKAQIEALDKESMLIEEEIPLVHSTETESSLTVLMEPYSALHISITASSNLEK